MATVVLGSQWGDEGKGKLVDILAQKSQLCLRGQGGHNAGHTIEANGKKFDFHILPSGLVNPQCVNLIGSGCVVYIPQFFKELETLQTHGLDTTERIFIFYRCDVILELHLKLDGLEEVELGKASIGTTGKGIGPTYSTKMSRSGIRIADIYDAEMLDTKVRRMASGFKKRFGDLLQYDVEDELARLRSYGEKLAPYIVDEIPLIRSAKEQKAQILVEGAQATMLDIDHGTYPFVTSSNCGLGGILTGTSLGWSYLKEVVGVVKAYTTRVGSGPFPTELLNETGEKLQQIGREVGVTTGRKRRCGALDLFLVKYSHEVNDYTSLNLTKLDVLDDFEELQVGIGYEIPGDGKMEPLDSFPASVKTLENVKVVYKTMKGWKSKTTGVSSYAELPKEAKEYIEFIEQYVGVPVKWIGTGPKREDTIIR